MKNLRTIAIAALAALVSGSLIVSASQTNYLGTVFIGDATTPANQLAIGSNGAISIVSAPSAASSAAIAPSVSGSASSSAVFKAAAGNLYGAYATCTAACWLMIFNAATAPGNGSTTAGTASGNMQDCIQIASGGSGSINYQPGPPELFSVGITAVISSTACGTLTASTVGFIHGSVQ